MPCYDGGEPRESECHQREINQIKDQLERRDAMLCAVLATLGTTGVSTMLSMLDERAAGITGREIVEWWMQHRHEDEIRHQRELKQRQERFEKKLGSFRSALTEEEQSWFKAEQEKQR
jgi:hypothetical protein